MRQILKRDKDLFCWWSHFRFHFHFVFFVSFNYREITMSDFIFLSQNRNRNWILNIGFSQNQNQNPRCRIGLGFDRSWTNYYRKFYHFLPKPRSDFQNCHRVLSKFTLFYQIFILFSQKIKVSPMLTARCFSFL